MSRSALRRVVEAFFHRWPFYLLLIVVALLAGVSQVRRGVDEYVSFGSILVKGNSLVTAQSGLQNEPYYGVLSASQYTNQELSGLIFTDSFMEAVAAEADIELPNDVTGRAFTIQALRAGLQTWSTSGTIVHVTATTNDPQLSADLATAVINQYLAFKRVVGEEESGASEEFFAELAEPYRLELERAREALDQALLEVDSEEDLTPAQELEINRLSEAEALASDRYQSAVRGLEDARLAELQIDTDLEQSYSVLDSPGVSDLPLGSRFDDVLVLTMFGLVGVLLAIAGPTFAALGNRVMVFADDLDDRRGVEVVAELPRFRRRDLDPSQAQTGPVAGADEGVVEAPPDEGELIAAGTGGEATGPGSGP